MASESTEYLGMTVYSDISGVYQIDLRRSYYQNWLILDAFAKAAGQIVAQLKQVAYSGSYNDLSDKPIIPAATPIATQQTAGKVKPDGVTITIDPDGTIRSAVTVDLATTETAGIVKPDGITVTVDANGTIRATCEIATLVKAGIVKPDGTTITVDANGVISGRDSYTKAEVDALLTETSELLISASDLEDLGDDLDTLMGESNTYTSLGAGIVALDDLADQLIS